MNDEHVQRIEIIKKIERMVFDGRMPLDMIPLSDMQALMEGVLQYDGQSDLERQIPKLFASLIQQQLSTNNKEATVSLISLMAKCMQSALEREDYYNQLKEEYNQLEKKYNQLQEMDSAYEDIVTHYKNNQIDERYINERTYQSLVAVKNRGNNSLFKEISHDVYEVALKQIKKKDKWKIVFLLKDSAEWSCEGLYQKLCNLPNVETEIVVVPFMMGTVKGIRDTYFGTIKYFEERGYNVVGIFNAYQNRNLSWKEIGMPDFVFHLNPHQEAFEESANICNFPLRVLNIYIPYSFMIYGNVDAQFNQISHMLYWKIFCETEMHRLMAAKYSDIGETNVIFSGYTKMDSFYKEQKLNDNEIWKISDNADVKRVKKIIYAPHWSIRGSYTGFGNFDKHYKEIYEYAKNHEETTSWIFRPHPMLRFGAVSSGLFANDDGYDAYLQMWNDLPNAKVSTEGTYTDIFKTSDTMILDSVSFMAEYLYVHKPMLFLTRERQTFNDFGEKLVDVLYKVDGGDFAGIEAYIEDVVVGNNDYMKELREDFYRKYLDYKEINGMIAEEFIINYITENCGMWKTEN